MIPQSFIVAAGAWLAFINLAAFAAFAWDKRQAIKGRRRFTEVGLIQLGALGGALGGALAMVLLRHKSNKPSFQRRFWNTFLGQLVIVCCLLVIWAVLRTP